MYFICSYLSAFSSVHNKICKTNNHDYGASTNLYSLNENGEIVRENLQKILSLLAAHQIILWEYDIPTGKCSFTDDYFRTLGLKEAGMVFKDINDFYRFAHPDDMDACQKSFAAMLISESKTSQIGFVVSENIRKLFGSKTIFSLIKEMMKHIRINFWHIL